MQVRQSLHGAWSMRPLQPTRGRISRSDKCIKRRGGMLMERNGDKVPVIRRLSSCTEKDPRRTQDTNAWGPMVGVCAILVSCGGALATNHFVSNVKSEAKGDTGSNEPSASPNPRQKPLQTSIAAVRGDRSYMEDTYYVSPCKRFAAVYDGHGGDGVSKYLLEHHFSFVKPELAEWDHTTEEDAKKRRERVTNCLTESLEKVDKMIMKRDEWCHQGSTAVGVMVDKDTIYSFNVGDSRAVLCRSGRVIELTHDHKPNDPVEQSRIEALGGKVFWCGYTDAKGYPIEPYGAYRVNGDLAIARAIGDRDLRPYVSGDVDVQIFDRKLGQDEFIVVASDGLWDVFTSQEAVQFVREVLRGEVGGRESWRSGGHTNTRVPIFEWSQQYDSDRSVIQAARARRKDQIADYLVQEALFRGSLDNVSVVVVWLK